jgi:Ca-activated chloride channel family protein
MQRFQFGLLIAFISMLVLACGLGGNVAQDDDEADGRPAPPDDALVVRMLYGSEKQTWIEAVTAGFNAQEHQSTDGQPIFVDAVPMGSAESMDLILSGEEQPAIWSPASGILIPVANERWALANAGATLVEDAPPLVLSPVVIAMWQPMAEALGWPDTPLGWEDIAELARTQRSWAEYDHPEWGSFQFGHTHPDYSNSGITSILATTYAATGKTRDLTVADVQQDDVREFLTDVESGVIHYGESTGFFGRQMFNRGPGYLSAAVLYENLVVESYDETLYPNRQLPVVAIYPKEGTFWSDHPFAILDAPWVDAPLRDAAEQYRDYLLAPAQQEQALRSGFRPSDTTIPITDPIIPANGVDPDEPQTLLAVPEAEVIETVRDLWGQTKKRVEVEIILDVSGSMEDEQRLVNAKAALVNFIGQLSNEDRLGITVFNEEASELTPLGPLGEKREQVLNRVDGLFATGGTRLIDTVAEVYAEMEQLPRGERIRAIVVLSDGADNESRRSKAELTQLLGGDQEGYSIKVFTIAYGTGSDVDTGLMADIADASGARTYQSGPTEIEQVYRDIATFF